MSLDGEYKTRALEGHAHRPVENMQTPHRKAFAATVPAYHHFMTKSAILALTHGAAAPLQQKEPVEVIQASDQEASQKTAIASLLTLAC